MRLFRRTEQQPELVPMTRDLTVGWKKHDNPALGGTFYSDPLVPRETNLRILDYLHDARLRSPEKNAAHLASGGRADCFREGDLVIKSFFSYCGNNPETEGGLSALRANVMLQVGFARTYTGEEPVTWRAPRMFGAFIPSDLKAQFPVWAMSYERGETLTDASDEAFQAYFPFDTEAFYNPIVARAGALAGDIYYDNKTENILLHQEDIQTILTKVDVTARRPYDF